MVKLILTCQRNTSLTREKFFNHLRHVHWPLLQKYPEILQAIPGYVQNHAVNITSAMQIDSPYNIADKRDSVIELFFHDPSDVEALVHIDNYQTYIRPDEQRFNDLEHNIMVVSDKQSQHQFAQTGRCKRFDFMVADNSKSVSETQQALEHDAQRLSLEPYYTAYIDQHTDNFGKHSSLEHGFGSGEYVCVREVWANSFDALSNVAGLYSDIEGVCRQQSFSVFTTEFVMQMQD
jgi:hypothetical protein